LKKIEALPWIKINNKYRTVMSFKQYFMHTV
jgi:hypothetical protein